MTIRSICLLALLGCAGTADLDRGSDQGQLRLILHDAPTVEVDEVWVAWDEVSVHGPSGWQIVSQDAASVDLLTLQGGVSTELGLAALPAGHYTQIRLHLTDSWVVDDGGVAPLDVPSGDTSGLKIGHGFDVPECGTLTLSLDWDVGAHLHAAGNGQLKLRPTIVVDDESVEGDCQTVVPLAASDAVISGGSNVRYVTALDDFDGDGIDDYVVAEHKNSASSYLFLGEVNGSVTVSAADRSWNLGQGSSRNIVKLGDVTGTGFSHFAHGYAGPVGRGLAVIFAGCDTVASPGCVPTVFDQTTAAVEFQGSLADLWSASSSMASQGDLTGNGSADVLHSGRVGGTGTVAYATVLYEGPLSGAYASGGAPEYMRFHDISGPRLADFNCDGVLDVIGSGPYADPGSPSRRLWHGFAGPFTGSPADRTLASADVVFRTDTNDNSDQHQFVDLGDPDGDGCRAFAIASRAWGPGEEGAVFGFTASAGLSGVVDLETAHDFRITGDVPGSYLGGNNWETGGANLVAHDMDSDGVMDIVVSSGVSPYEAGSVLIFDGTRLTGGADLVGSDANVVIAGSGTSSLGLEIAAFDDNGDGHPDLGVAAVGPGAVYIFRGPW